MSPTKNNWLCYLATLGVGIGILIALVYCAGFDRFREIAARTSFSWMIVSVVFYAAAWFLRTWRLRLFANRGGTVVKTLDLFKLYIAGFALNSILPARLGDLVTAGFLKAKGMDWGRSAAIVVQSRILDAFGLVLLALPALVALLRERVPPWILMALFLGSAAVLVPVGLAALDTRNAGAALLERLGGRARGECLKRVLAAVRLAYDRYREILSDRRLLLTSTALSLLIVLCEGLTCGAIAVAVGVHTSLMAAFAAVSIATFGKAAPSTPGGVGIYEGVMAGVLVLFGADFDGALVVAILDHGTRKVFNLLWGLPVAIRMGLNLSQIREAAGQAGSRKDDVEQVVVECENCHEG